MILHLFQRLEFIPIYITDLTQCLVNVRSKLDKEVMELWSILNKIPGIFDIFNLVLDHFLDIKLRAYTHYSHDTWKLVKRDSLVCQREAFQTVFELFVCFVQSLVEVNCACLAFNYEKGYWEDSVCGLNNLEETNISLPGRGTLRVIPLLRESLVR